MILENWNVLNVKLRCFNEWIIESFIKLICLKKRIHLVMKHRWELLWDAEKFVAKIKQERTKLTIVLFKM